MIVDALGRRFRNLRVSLTAACNYACSYCVPDGKRLQSAQHELDGEELAYAVELVVDAAGIEQLRITGGEPLLSPKFDEVLPRLMALSLEDVSITTNGQLVPRKIDLLLESGLERINVSLDTLDPARFQDIARGGDLDTVLGGIEALASGGLKIKINMVPMRTANLDQLVPMLDFCLDRGFELRYIELMNMGHLRHGNQYLRDFVGMEEILEAIGERYEFTRTDAPYDSTAVRYEIPGRGFFGIIANETEPFCSSCTRLRLSSNGFIYGCLSNTARHDIKPLLTLPRHQAIARLQGLLVEALADKQDLGFTGEVTVMKFIGG
ncbi:MAG: radical SAM protein [Pseudomonadales bacterium]|nr:radical SAM protein [Pseudomonadales bacterium]NIX09012.1 radical SAM protein [Pseudomonadales bacterium]